MYPSLTMAWIHGPWDIRILKPEDRPAGFLAPAFVGWILSTKLDVVSNYRESSLLSYWPFSSTVSVAWSSLFLVKWPYVFKHPFLYYSPCLCEHWYAEVALQNISQADFRSVTQGMVRVHVPSPRSGMRWSTIILAFRQKEQALTDAHSIIPALKACPSLLVSTANMAKQSRIVRDAPTHWQMI